MSDPKTDARFHAHRRLRGLPLACALALCGTLLGRPAAAADQVYFSANTNVTQILVNYINQETVRLDISSWYLSEHAISIAIANRFAAGVPVRIIGDRAAVFEDDPHTKTEFYWLASQGVPIRLRFNPTWFPEIDHWKAAIFVGQNVVEFGSGNFSPTELAPVSSTNFDDESEMFTSDPDIVNAFKTKFDTMWNDTTTEPESIISGPPYLKDWNDACAHEPTGNCADYATQYPNPAPMVINTARLEPDYPTPPDLIWGQGPDFNNRQVQEIDNESARIDFVIYRLEDSGVTQALLRRFRAGVPIRMIVDPAQYTDIAWPEYWLTHANIDLLWAAGVPILQRTHAGVTHMKTLITSNYATNASSNIGPNWQRDHDYFVSAATKPAIYQAFENRFQAMWTDSTNFGPLVTTRPNPPDLVAPASGAGNTAVNTTFVWNTAAWAVSYDVYLGTSPSTMALVANVPAQLVLNPPTTYSWTPTSPLQYGTTYYWSVVSRTNATPVDPSMIASSSVQSFSTPPAGSQPPIAAYGPAPTTGASGVGRSPVLSWSGAGATSYTVNLGTANPPPQAATGLTSPSYTPGTLAAGTTYFWQVTSINAAGSTPGPLWTFTTAGSSLSAPWQSQDVGAVGRPGSSSSSGGQFTVSGAGADIWGTSDAFQFAYQPLNGDGQVVARVTSIQNTSGNAKAGVMFRNTPDAAAADVLLDVEPGGNVEFMSRGTDGGSTSWLAGASRGVPVWLKITRSGSTFTGFVSTDGSSWSMVGSATANLATAADVGLVVSSHDTSTLNTSTFDSVAVTGNAGFPGAPASPAPSNGATGVGTAPVLTWSSSGATSYDVKFGTANPPPQVATGQTAASYSPPTLATGTVYFWQIVAHNGAGTTPGQVWSFTTSGSSLAPPWQSQDVGAVGQAGSSSSSGGQFTVKGAGADIWGNADAFQFAYQGLNGDGQIVARVTSIQNTNGNAKAGVMFRGTTAAGSANVMIDVEPGGNIEFMSRATNGGSTAWLAGTSQLAPVWLKLTRSGSTYSGFVSSDGSNWAMVGSATVSLPGTADVGLVVSSHDTSVLNTSTFDSIGVTSTAGFPGAPSSPSPADNSTGVGTTPTLTWNASGATSYDVNFGTANPPPSATTGQSAASFSPGALANGTTYFWQVVAHNSSGATSGPVWSFTTAPSASATDVVIYAGDIPAANLHGAWAAASDATAAGGTKLVTPDSGLSNANAPLASPTDYVDVTFTADAGTPYTIWLRLQALNNSKYNDSLWVQFSDAKANGSGIYPLNSTSGLLVNLATDSSGASDQGWGWVNGAYWLAQTTTVTFASSGSHTLRIQTREDGVEFDQIVLSPATYLNAAPGPASNDATIVPKP